MDWIIISIIGYLIGSISMAYIWGKILLRKDLSEEGTGNLGAHNSFQIGGAVTGVLVFLTDVLKGLVAMLIIKHLYQSPLALYLGALAVVVGHDFSLYLKFRGGKGLAAMVGILTIISPHLLLVTFIVAVVAFLMTRDAGVSTILFAIPFPFFSPWVVGDWSFFPFGLAIALVVLYKHRSEEWERLFRFLQRGKN